jgi:ABC-type transport system involved in multi-copper enzyme maturation permease subunit
VIAPAHFVRLVLAEARKVFTRGSGIAAMIVAVAAAVLVVVGIKAIHDWGVGQGANINGMSPAELLSTSGPAVAGWALQVRNFFVLPLFLLLSAAGAFAGEHKDRTLRELLVRPVPRWSVLAAKLVALSKLSAVTLLLTMGPAMGLGVILFGATPVPGEPGMGQVALGYAASFLSDVGLLAVAMLVSLFVGSVGGVVVAMTLMLMADLALRGVLNLASTLGAESAASLLPWTLGNALGCWEGWKDGWEPARFVALATVVVISCGLGVARFGRMDVP